MNNEWLTGPGKALACLVLCPLLLLLTPASHAQPWPNFSATFDVKVMGFTVGQAHHAFYCVQNDCHLTSTAAPSSWAKAFINEETVDKIDLTYHPPSELTWQRSVQQLTRFYDDRVHRRQTEIVRQTATSEIVSPDKNKSFPSHPHAYDQISLAYALGFYARRHQQADHPLPEFALQRDKAQTPIHINQAFQPRTLDLPFSDDVTTLYFSLLSDKIRIELWLMPQKAYFPAKVRVEKAEQGRTIELMLNKPPKL
ncbi:DUF3108 domain-containing protein [Thiomicrospira sp. WB1]|uniref:DUF3108 domain-containing protein n=1 Tax=Thiomicrospira sp. WB1 TaxID=1685380 RepID=UPI000748B1A7|nr:DUF3108 domain-containing protein [Thiomicrospira sp. WB1]KUJ72172.1 hypothetical protein AVO41_07040 [Thiomicrospira sp. WB1]